MPALVRILRTGGDVGMSETMEIIRKPIKGYVSVTGLKTFLFVED
jgi:hypothetical protein